ncbi:DNA mismatch repair protein MutT [Iodidimonas nitroreducens]|uniref:DNA mismatch repair protein MutT n=1 Tax=Iodidimonas nitroreducens TaxID=1236968 RepID=A0A5A7NF00_9PROT|nr:NUDIX domain-containing protein [Iodidimonas nitroreducens]GAK34001.1 ADP-ribose pyrophosphatase [alpha proteobacterium Q-1]GER05546.1 DNA mismatch repair protein MutT [Iodidimonas nitroreducens]
MATLKRPLIGIGVVVLKEDCVLLIRRGKPPKAGEWSLPGGAQEWGETTHEAARREVYEETGIEIEIIGLLDVVDGLMPDGKGDYAFHYTLIDYHGRWMAGTPKAASDAADAAWVRLDHLDDYGLWDETRRVIALAQKA